MSNGGCPSWIARKQGRDEGYSVGKSEEEKKRKALLGGRRGKMKLRIVSNRQGTELVVLEDLRVWLEERIDYHKTHYQAEEYYMRMEELLAVLDGEGK